MIPTFVVVVLLTELAVNGAAQDVSLKPTAPETFWPTSIMAWGAVLGFVFLAVEKIYKAWRHTQDPIEKKIDDTVEHFDGQVKSIRADMSDALARFQALEIERRNAFREAVTHDLNGWAKRIDHNTKEIDEAHAEVERAHRSLEEQARAFIKFETESRADRAHINQRLGTFEGKLDAMIAAHNGIELRIMSAVNQAIREAISNPQPRRT